MRLLALLLIVGLAPGVAETVVDVGHAVINGHSLHDEMASSDHHGDAAAHDEHGCSALFHLCGCHAPAPTTTSTSTDRLSFLPTRWSELTPRSLPIVGALLTAADGSRAQENRPPIV